MQQLFQELENSFLKQVPFSYPFDFNIVSLDNQTAVVKFEMQQKLVGNILNGSLHGGATATVFDSVGGLLAMSSLLNKMEGGTREECIAKLGKTSTVNMHINYISLGLGDHFIATAHKIQSGNKLFRCNMSLKNHADKLIAESSATYLTSVRRNHAVI